MIHSSKNNDMRRLFTTFLSFSWFFLINYFRAKLWNRYKKLGNSNKNDGIFICNNTVKWTWLQNGTKYYSISRFKLDFSLKLNDVIFESSDTLGMLRRHFQNYIVCNLQIFTFLQFHGIWEAGIAGIFY